MTEYADEPLVSRDVSIRRTEQQNLKTDQQKQMDNRRVDAPSSAFHQSVSAATDTYMRDALSQVRQIDVTHNEDLMRLHGTWIWNKK